MLSLTLLHSLAAKKRPERGLVGPAHLGRSRRAVRRAPALSRSAIPRPDAPSISRARVSTRAPTCPRPRQLEHPGGGDWDHQDLGSGTFSERDRWGRHQWCPCKFHVFVYKGLFWVLPLTYIYLPKSASAYLFPQSARIHYFCSGPITVDPIRPQPLFVVMLCSLSVSSESC